MDNHTNAQNNNRTLLGVLAYLGPLLIVSYIMGNKDSFVKFHIKQGLLLLIIQLVLWFVGPVFWFSFLYNIIRLVDFILFIYAVLGIVAVTQGKEKELPIIGHLAHSFKI